MCDGEHPATVRFSAPRRLLIAFVTLLCLTQVVAGAGVGVAATADTGDVSVGGGAADVNGAAAAQTTPSNNTTVQQENPEEADEQGDTDAVRSHLAQQLAERLGGSSVEISQGQYEQGQSVLGGEYDSILEQYVDVSGGTGDNPGADSFEEARESQREYAGLLQQYNETYEEYQAARDAGNETEARELARELDRLASQINQTGGNTTRSYTRVENATGEDLSNATRQIENVTRRVTAQQETVVSETFVRTNLTVRTDAVTAGFGAPARINGRVTLENGSALANESVQLRIGGQNQTVETDRDGSFSLDYRPVRESVETESISVRYRPAGGSAYLGSNASLALGIQQTSADLTVTSANETAAFGEQVVVDGHATVNGTPVPNARVRVRVGGVALETVTTGDDGNYRVAADLPSTVPDGGATVEAKIVPADRAVRSETATGQLQVEQTETALSLSVSETEPGVRATGALRTADERPLDGETVELRVDGTTVATVETGNDGQFDRSVALSEDRTGAVTVTAVFDEPRGNLDSSTAEEQLNLQTETPEAAGLPVSPELLGGGGVAVVSLLVIGWLLRREDTASDPAAPVEPSTATDTAASGTESASTGTRDLLEQAASRASAGESDAAVQALYAAVRRSMDCQPQQTHWEFYAAAADRLDTEAAGTLERLTEAYEQAAYSPRGVDPPVVDDLLDRADRLVDRSDTASE